MSTQSLSHINSPTVPLACTTTSARIALPAKGGYIRAVNIGTSPTWNKTGDATVVAVASTGDGVCVPPGAVETFRMGPTDTNVAGVTATGTATMSYSVVTGP